MENTQKFCPHLLIKKAEKLYCPHWKELTIFSILFFVLSGFGKNVTDLSLWNILLRIVFLFVSFYFSILFIQYLLKILDGKKVSLFSFLKESISLKMFSLYVVVLFLTKILRAFVSLVFSIIPISVFVLLFIKLQPVLGSFTLPLFIFAVIAFIIFTAIIQTSFLFPEIIFVDKKDKGVFDSIEYSWKLSDGYRLKLFILLIFLTLLNIAGFLAFFVGIFVTIPISFLSIFIAYRELEKRKISTKKGV